MKKTQILISGMPGFGKSTFGEWLGANKQFAYIDMEHDGLDRCGFREAWNRFNQTSDAQPFIAAVQGYHSSVVLDWGFPVSCIDLIRRLKEAGLMMFWFEGDRLAGRHYFKQRGTVPVSAFDCQYSEVSAHWAEIASIFGDNIIKTVHTDGTRISPDTIFTNIFGRWI